MRHDFVIVPRPGVAITGVVRVPGDKSISHRAILFAALGEGHKALHGLLRSEDCMHTLRAIESLGIAVTDNADSIDIAGRGLCGLQAPVAPIDCGNSGTGMRLLAGLLSVQPFDSELVGDESLSRRPMHRVAEPLNAAGARVETGPQGTPPLKITGGKKIATIDYEMPVASAQVKSALLLAALAAGVRARITEPDASRDHTERMLASYGVAVHREERVLQMEPAAHLAVPARIDIPADLSSAAFHMVLATLLPGGRIELPGVGVNPSRDGVLRILVRMGANIEIRRRGNESRQGEDRQAEPLADIVSRHSSLKAVDIDAGDVALAVDEIPILLVAAACATGTTRLRGAAELRVKESDRLAVMAAGLRTLGIEVAEYPDGLDVTGGRLAGGEVNSQGDHRIAMAFAIAGVVADGPVRIRNVVNVATSYPEFRRDMASLGVQIEEIEVDE